MVGVGLLDFHYHQPHCRGRRLVCQRPPGTGRRRTGAALRPSSRRRSSRCRRTPGRKPGPAALLLTPSRSPGLVCPKTPVPHRRPGRWRTRIPRPACSVTNNRSSPAIGWVRLVRPRKSRFLNARSTCRGLNSGGVGVGSGGLVADGSVGEGVSVRGVSVGFSGDGAEVFVGTAAAVGVETCAGEVGTAVSETCVGKDTVESGVEVGARSPQPTARETLAKSTKVASKFRVTRPVRMPLSPKSGLVRLTGPRPFPVPWPTRPGRGTGWRAL